VTRQGPEGSNPSPGALLEVLAKAIKLIERANSRQNQRIDVIENFCNRLTEAATTTTTTVLRPEAVQSCAVISRPCRGIAERKRLTAEEGLQALDKNLCIGTVVAKTLKLNGKNR
jgi:hypothetical protein